VLRHRLAVDPGQLRLARKPAGLPALVGPPAEQPFAEFFGVEARRRSDAVLGPLDVDGVRLLGSSLVLRRVVSD